MANNEIKIKILKWEIKITTTDSQHIKIIALAMIIAAFILALVWILWLQQAPNINSIA